MFNASIGMCDIRNPINLDLSRKEQFLKLLPKDGIGKNTLSFLSSIQVESPDDVPDGLEIHPEALTYICDYNNTKQELALRLFSIYNKEVFNYSMPTDMKIVWSNRLLTTAGHYSWRKMTITLSEKVLQTPSVLVDTLLHEMCHAAVKIVDKMMSAPPHGAAWSSWCKYARNRLPEIPKTTPRHSYDIIYPFEFQCKSCKVSIGRFSSKMPTAPCYLCGITGSFVLRN